MLLVCQRPVGDAEQGLFHVRLDAVSFPGTRMREARAGLFQSSYADRPVYGHQGSIPSYVTAMQHEPISGLTIAMISNVGSGYRMSFYASGLHAVLNQAIGIILDS